MLTNSSIRPIDGNLSVTTGPGKIRPGGYSLKLLDRSLFIGWFCVISHRLVKMFVSLCRDRHTLLT